MVDIAPLSGRQIIDNGNLTAACDQCVGEVTADEPCSAREQEASHFHRCLSVPVVPAV
jgi:hypothetical protein